MFNLDRHIAAFCDLFIVVVLIIVVFMLHLVLMCFFDLSFLMAVLTLIALELIGLYGYFYWQAPTWYPYLFKPQVETRSPEFHSRRGF